MEYTISILLLPMLTFLVLGLFGMKLRPNTAGYIGSLSLAVTTGLAYITAGLYFSAPRVDGVFARIMPVDFEWLRFTEALHIDLGILLDPISVMMLVVITTVSLMVHIYSMGYMKGERGFQRYYAFLSLFTFSMLGLVVAPNIFQMYIFWELVGVSSYLLIGFYYTKPEAIAASKKAFIVTRFADLGFLLGILLLSYFTKTFSCRCHFHGSFRDELGLGSDIHRWCRKIGNVPITHLVTGRDGRSYPGIGSDSCSNDGGCRRFSRGPSVPCIRQCSPGCVGRHRLCGGFYFVVCSRSSLRTNRYQTGTGFFYHLSDRFHDGCARSLGYGRPSGTRLYGFDVPPFHTCHVQSPALPLRRSHHPYHRQQ